MFVCLEVKQLNVVVANMYKQHVQTFQWHGQQLGDCEFESWWCHKHLWLGVWEWSKKIKWLWSLNETNDLNVSRDNHCNINQSRVRVGIPTSVCSAALHKGWMASQLDGFVCPTKHVLKNKETEEDRITVVSHLWSESGNLIGPDETA